MARQRDRLAVDDEEIIRDIGKEMLESLGYSVLTAVDGQEAMDFFREQGDKIDLVLLDMTMPRMDGIEAFRELRRARSGGADHPFQRLCRAGRCVPVFGKRTIRVYPEALPDG